MFHICMYAIAIIPIEYSRKIRIKGIVLLSPAVGETNIFRNAARNRGIFKMLGDDRNRSFSLVMHSGQTKRDLSLGRHS